jgi:maltose O-acetyltransferase
MRLFYLRKILGVIIGKDTFVSMGTYFNSGEVQIGNNVVIGYCCYISGDVTIRDNVGISSFCHIQSSTHDPNSPEFKCYSKKIEICENVWIGVRSVVLPGVIMAEGSILGAQSILTKNTQPYTIWAGSPAKKISDRSRNLNYKLLYFPLFG